ncbi:MAG: helix-turn-helix transcriptional regulator [Mogibacterium sp.]|nr:helix-turn-helix transcriptional regulator [Mogibacterium sp.]
MSTRIKELRQEKQMTLLEVAKRLGVSESTVQRYESGAISNLKYETIISLSSLFGVDPCYLMGWDVSASGSSISIEVSSEERRLVEMYRSLNIVGRRKALESVEDLTQIEKYIKISDGDRSAV